MTTTEPTSSVPQQEQNARLHWHVLAAGALIAVVVAAATLADRFSGRLPFTPPGYAELQDQVTSSVWGFLWWNLGDLTEHVFYSSALGGVGLLLGGWLAYSAARRSRRWAGFPLSAGSGLWPWVLAAALLSVVLSNLAWGWTVSTTGTWLPTFVGFVSVPPTIVLTYGAGWRVALTGAVLGATLTAPTALLLVHYVTTPLALPAVVGSVTAMWVSALLAFPLCRRLAWMPTPLPPSPPPPASPPQGRWWVARRALADFTEAPFFGNEWASAGLITGALITHLLNSNLPVYGGDLLIAVLTSQIITATLAVLLYRRQHQLAGWYPTFVPIVSVAPAVVLTYGPTTQAVVCGAVLGAICGPPLAAATSRRLPPVIHPFVGNVFSMTVCTAATVVGLGFFPGFDA